MLLGIDIGTGGSRAVVIDREGSVVASATEAHIPFRSPRATWAEQDPEDWWEAAARAIRAVFSRGEAHAADIDCIGLSGQMHGAVLLDRQGDVVRPALIWCDQRTTAECEWLDSHIGASRIIELTSNPPLTNFTLTKLLWVRDHEPDAWRRVAHVLLPKDYIRFKLSDVFATDMADASGTLMLDVARRAWSSEMLAACGIERRLLPDVLESPAIAAHLSARAAEAIGLPAGTPIVAGAGDQAAGAVGTGITRPGSVGVTIGTSGVVFAATDRPTLDARGRIHTFCHAVPDRWHVMGVTQSAGLSLRWLRDLTLGRAAGDAAYEQLTSEARDIPAGADGVLWAPYLMGERTPHCDPHARAALVGLSANHTRGHVARAVLEGVAFSLQDSFEIFRELDVPVQSVRVAGGGARSALWREIQAGVYGCPVQTVAAEEGAAYGAAILAGVGVGIWPSVDQACDRVVRADAITTPRPEDIRALAAQYRRYRRMYPALRTIDQQDKDVVHG